jgi:hypothetical protein
MQIKTIAIDLGKTACEVVALDGCGKVVARRRLTRPKLIAWLADRPPAGSAWRHRAAPTIWRAGCSHAATRCA